MAVGYAFAWLVRKAKRVAGQADEEVDRGLEAAMDRLHELISAKLGQDPALERAGEEAEAGQMELSPRTRQRLELAVEDAAERDSAFSEALNRAVKDLQAATTPVGGVSVTGDGQAVGGDVDIRAEHGSVAALRMGDVSLGNPSAPGPDQG
ncbi:hypothetical protein AAW14_04970 [Streptomyces hygroscopicus]|nr:hypothetical protein [Streptomyces hygroscopicus]